MMFHFSSKCADEINILYQTNARLKIENDLLKVQYVDAVDTIQTMLVDYNNLKYGAHFDPNLVKDAHTISVEDINKIKG